MSSPAKHTTLPLRAAEDEVAAYRALAKALRDTPIADNEVLANLPLFLTRSSLSHILFMDRLYTRIVNVPGIIAEFGVRWGRNLALLHSLRTIYEPYNTGRRIVGFDTFTGFPDVTSPDGTAAVVRPGAFSVEPGYEGKLEDLLAAHEKLGPRSQIRRFDLVKGDVSETVPRYFADNPSALIALAYLDLDLFKPTYDVLQALKSRLLKGSVLVLDQFGLEDFPGETQAFVKAWGNPLPSLRRDPGCAYQAYLVVE
jgi:hypothetical protein